MNDFKADQAYINLSRQAQDLKEGYSLALCHRTIPEEGLDRDR